MNINKIVATFAIIMSISTSANADITIKQYYEMKKNNDTKNLATMYMISANESFGYANSVATENGKPIYCQPMKFSMSANDMTTIVENSLFKMRKIMTKEKWEEFQEHPISALIIDALMEEFPC